jgi:hypothetical protein
MIARVSHKHCGMREISLLELKIINGFRLGKKLHPKMKLSTIASSFSMLPSIDIIKREIIGDEGDQDKFYSNI